MTYGTKIYRYISCNAREKRDSYSLNIHTMTYTNECHRVSKNQQRFGFGLTGYGVSKLEPNRFLNKLRLFSLAKLV